MLEGQDKIFEQAKRSMAHELDDECLKWNFAEMLDQLKALIEARGSAESGNKNNMIRYFARHYLDMHGSSFNEVRAWFFGTAMMPGEKIQLALRVLQASRDGSLNSPHPRQMPSGDKADRPKGAVVRQESSVVPRNSGMIRKLIDHATTLFNSLMILIVEAGVNSDDLYDGDRIQIRIALKNICDAFGIDVIFPEPKTARNQPVTRQDFADIGLQTREQRRKKRS